MVVWTLNDTIYSFAG